MVKIIKELSYRLLNGDAGSAIAHHGSTLLTMTPYALFNLKSKALGVTLSPSKGECGRG